MYMPTNQAFEQSIGQPEQILILTTREAATYLGLSVSTLNKWRCYGTGPKFLKLGRAVRYRQLDLAAFIDARQAVNTIY